MIKMSFRTNGHARSIFAASTKEIGDDAAWFSLSDFDRQTCSQGPVTPVNAHTIVTLHKDPFLNQ
jgi:hypothetical protein